MKSTANLLKESEDHIHIAAKCSTLLSQVIVVCPNDSSSTTICDA